MKVILASPPFAGHLNPILGIGRGLKQSKYEVMILTGPNKQKLVQQIGLPCISLLTEQPNALEDIANTEKSTAFNPLIMYNQLRENVNLIPIIRQQAVSLFKKMQPDIVLADFTAIPIVLACEQLNIPCITVAPTPFAVETADGIPSYLGGWEPKRGSWGKARNYVGRKMVRLSKKIFTLPFRNKLKQQNYQIYRSDGTERAFSHSSILGLGMAELEFPRTWPNHFKMIGPVLFTPEKSQVKLPLNGLKNIFVTLGTHVKWAKARIRQLLMALCSEFPHYKFIVSLGKPEHFSPEPIEDEPGFAIYSFIPYEGNIAHFDVVICHGGSGIVHYCIQNGKPMIVCPLDYDQFDFGARVNYFKAGINCKRLNSKAIISALKKMMDGDFSGHNDELKKNFYTYNPIGEVEKEIQRLV